MNISDNSMIAILLTSYIGINGDYETKPFTLGEWYKFLDKLKTTSNEPKDILSKDSIISSELNYNNAETRRIKKLVSRGGAVAFEIENLSKKGIGIITLFDKDYPVLLIKKLKRKAPPVLFYAGDIELVKKIGIGVVGSRKVDQDRIDFTRKLVSRASKERLVIYSGGAKGVDLISQTTAIQHGSAVVSFIADSLINQIKKKDVLKNITSGKLLLLSDTKPDVGFNVGRAMNRNKYIYASSYGTFVVSSDYKKGGTWNGAIENLKNNWTKEFVWNNSKYEGNIKLIERGAIPFELDERKIIDVIKEHKDENIQLNIFSMNSVVREDLNEKDYKEKVINIDLYEVVRDYILENIYDGLTVNEASEQFKVAKGQMKTWLDRLREEGKLKFKKGIYYKK